MNKNLERKVNILTGYAVASLLIFGYIFFSSFSSTEKHEKADELTVKRLNIIGEDGSLRMVMANETRQHPGRLDGKDIPPRERPAGIIFFDNKGNECGGLIFEVNEDNDKAANMMSFTMDNYRNDQVVQILNSEAYENGTGHVKRGLIINEYPVGSSLTGFLSHYEKLEQIKDSTARQQKIDELVREQGGKTRLFVGRTPDNRSGLFLYDTAGKPRMEIFVDKTGAPRMRVIDENGQFREVTL